MTTKPRKSQDTITFSLPPEMEAAGAAGDEG